MNDDREDGLLAWQLAGYDRNHTTRANLWLHVVAVPLFWSGTLSVLSAWSSFWLLPSGLAMMVLALALEGRGHRTEPEAPVPFRSPLDAVVRLAVEQWVTFPRWVLGGGLSRALRAAR